MPKKKVGKKPIVAFSDASSDEEEVVKYNEKFEDNITTINESEELQTLTARYGEDARLSDASESSDTSDDEFVEPVNPEFDRDFLRTLGALHSKNYSQLQDMGSCFKERYGGSSGNKEQEKTHTLKDHERLLVTGNAEDSDEENLSSKFEGEQPQAESRASLIEEFRLAEDDSSDGEGASGGIFTRPAQKKSNRASKKQEDAMAYVRGEVKETGHAEDENLLRAVKQAWNDPSMSKDDKFVIDYIMNYRHDDDNADEDDLLGSKLVDQETLSEDEETLEKQETFASKYRFRFQEPGNQAIKQHPRSVEDSVRLKNEKRKDKREEKRLRKDEVKDQRRQEILQLQALKRKDIEEKIKTIKSVAGIDVLQVQDDDVEGDFDPAAHDAAMAKMFDADYYGEGGEDQEKPTFSDDDVNEDLYEDYDWLQNDVKKEDGQEGPYCEDPDFIMDAEDPRLGGSGSTQQEEQKTSQKKSRRRRTKFAEAVQKEKPIFDPQDKTFDEYVDEYYALDAEDIVGGIACRFGYKLVTPNNFGLSTNEILRANDRELNRWFGLKKLLRHNRTEEEERQDRLRFANKAANEHAKQKALPSLFEEDMNLVEREEREREKKRMKNLKRKQRKREKLQDLEEGSEAEETNDEKKPKETGSDVDVTQEEATNTDDDVKQELTDDDGGKQELGETNEKSTSPTKKKKKKKKKNKESKEQTTEVNENEEETPKTKTNGEAVNGKRKRSKSNRGEEQQQQQLKKRPRGHDKKKRPQKEDERLAGMKGISDARLLAYGENPKKIKQKVKYGSKKFE